MTPSFWEFKAIRQISRSKGLKNLHFISDLGKITRLVAAIKFLRLDLLVTHWAKIIDNLINSGIIVIANLTPGFL